MRKLFFQWKTRVTTVFSLRHFPQIPRRSRLRLGFFGIVFGILALWFFSQFVLAERVARVYVFPSSVTSEGWEEPNHSLGQELSQNAELVDFTRENSAYVFYGKPEPTPSAEEVVATTSQEVTPEDAPVPTQEGDEGVSEVSQDASVESDAQLPPTEEALPANETPALTVPNPYVPELPMEVPKEGGEEVAPPEATQSAFFDATRRVRSWFSPRIVLALDAPETQSEVTSPSPDAPATSTDNEYLAPAPEEVPTPAPLPESTDAVEEVIPESGGELNMATSGSEVVSPESTLTPSMDNSDPYSVALCTTLGKTCHVLEYSGFGLGNAMDGKTFVNADIEISLAGRGEFSGGEYDRVLVRAYHAGRWEFLGETVIRGDLSNGKRGGYLAFPITSFGAWDDLTDLKIALEYDRASEGDASLYVDGIWVNAEYSSDDTEDETPEDVALGGANIRSALSAQDAEARRARRDQLLTPDGEQITFTATQPHPEAKLIVKADHEVYPALGNTRVYFSVTNESDSPEEFRLQFHFPKQEARIISLAEYAHNVPHNVAEATKDDIGYFCDAGWIHGEGDEAYRCELGGELRSCDRLNTDRTNCIIESVHVGSQLGVSYRDRWQRKPIKEGSIDDASGIFAKAISRILSELPPDSLPSSVAPLAHTEDAVFVPAGQTVYFRMDADVSLNSRGDFFIEAVTGTGAFGLVEASWDGSWNHEFTVSIETGNGDAEQDIAVPIDLATFPPEFWDEVKEDGGDLRVVNSAETGELPLFLSSWNYEKREGLLWTRLRDIEPGTTTDVHIYFGNPSARFVPDSLAPFRTESLTPRGMVFGGSQTDTSLHIIALDEVVRARIGEGDLRVLAKGESTIFEDVAPGAVVYADGPVTGSIDHLGSGARYVPMGYAGGEFMIPELASDADDHELALGVSVDDVVHAELAFSSGSEYLDPIFGSIVGRPIELLENVPLLADADVLAVLSRTSGAMSPLAPLSARDLYGFAFFDTHVVASRDGTSFTALCGSGARKEIDGRRKGVGTPIEHCQSGPPALADPVRLLDVPLPLTAYSTIGNEVISYLSKGEFFNEYTTPKEFSGLLVLCAPEDGEIALSLFDPEGGLMATSSCSGNGPRPGKSHITPSSGMFPSGTIIRSSRALPAPFLAFGVESLPGVTDANAVRVSPLIAPTLARAPGSKFRDATVSSVSFVIPGEHRKLDVDEDGKEKVHVDTLLSKDREFSIREKPKFRFQYKRQSRSLLQNVRNIFGAETFQVKSVTLRHPMFSDTVIPYEVEYGENNEWSLTLLPENAGEAIQPGKYTLRMEIEEGGDVYVDEFDFFWGVLAINYTKSVYTPGERVDIALGAISNNGNTICDAHLKLWIKDTLGAETEVPVAPSGKCNGNNVVDVPDYSASYQLPSVATGTYSVRLVRFDEEENVASQVTDAIIVVERVPYVVERYGPTRIYPLAHYPMKIRIRANEPFEGNVIERIPGDFVVIDRGNADLEWGDAEHSFITATWPIKLDAGGFIDLEYIFDAGDRSPYLYLLGPLRMEGIADNDEQNFTEYRAWQIASDAAGKMLLFLENGIPLPSGWTCMSCISTDTFFERFAFGSSTYGGLGGTATHTPTATAGVDVTASTGVGPNTTNNTNNAPLAHTHTLTPQISGVSNLPSYKDLRIIRSNSAGDPGTIPAGAIGIFDVASSSLPSGWYRYDPLDGRYARGASSTATGGVNTHNHSATGTLAMPPQSGLRSQGGVPNGSATVLHQHTLSTINTDTVNHEPPYVEVLYAKLNTASATPNYLITMWDDTPPVGWATISNSGGAFDGKFLKASTTYGATGGSSLHAHADITGATSTTATTTSGYNVNASNAQAPAAHIHDISITGFSNDTHLPRYVEVIYAKRLTGISVLTQDSYRVYANATNLLDPTDPWPPGGSDISENTPVDSALDALIPGNVMRLRMNVFVENATSTVGGQQYKLQYVASNDCPNALNWTDVGAIGAGGALWRGYNNSGVTNHATIGTLLLSSSTVLEAYTEENNSTGTPTQVDVGGVGEWDWVVQDNLAVGNTTYCFRMVKSDGTPFDHYVEYPSILTNAPPQQTNLVTPFPFEKVATTTPGFQFYASDPETNDLDYQIQVAVSATFTSPIIDSDSIANPELFENVPNPANKAPFNSGETIQYRPASGLTNGTTYWWRARAKDTNASNEWGPWSATSSITIDTTVTASTWFQTTRDQFALNTLDGVTTTADAMTLISGSSTGTVYSPTIEFSDASSGTAWGSLAFTDVETSSDVKYQIEYFTSTSSWALIPESGLSGNNTGFDTSPVSLLGVDPEVYATIRIRANLTNIGASPSVNDWTLSWGYNVSTPVLTTPFDNQKVATRTPSFEWSATDPQGDAITYQISWSTDPNFTSSTTRESNLHSGFLDLSWATDTDPFGSGDRIRYTVQVGDILASSTTYFWRVRGRDPGGANTYSFWSDVRSIHVDTTVTVSTWYQTADGQWNTDTLTSLFTTGTGSTTVSTTTDEIMLAYGEGAVQTPRYRIFNGLTLGSELSALSVGSTIQWLVLKASSISGQYIMGTLGSDRDMNFQVYENGSWGNLYEAGTNAPSIARRSFDVAYESISGRALAVTCNSSPDPDYRIWDGSAWAATGTINLGFTSNCEWVRLASNPISNEIIGLFRNTGSSYEAQVWNATSSTWGNSTTHGSMTEIAHEGMAVEYEQSGDQGIIAVSNGGNASFISNFWSGTAWAGASTTALGDDFEWGNLRRNVGNDQMALCYVDQDNDVGVKRWSGTGWVVPHDELDIAGPAHTGRIIDCMFEKTPGRTNYIATTYATTAGTGYRYWNTASWVAETSVGAPELPTTFTHQLARTNASGTILGIFYDTAGNDYEFGQHFGTQAWSSAFMQTIEDTASVTASPYGEPFYMASKNPTTLGTILSTPIDFDEGVAPAWKRALWDVTTPGLSTFKVQVEYQTASGTWALIPDTDIPDNSTGTSTSPISMTSLDTNTYNVLRLKGNFTCVSGNCPTLNEWTVEWAAGVRISGIARGNDLTTLTTSGTVAVAVGGTLQNGKTGTIDASGNWFIDNVTVFPGNVLTIFVDGAADADEAVAVAKYTGPGDAGGMLLAKHWLTTGSASTTGQVVTLQDIDRYDNSASADEDIFYNVDPGGDYNNCVTGVCLDSSIYAYSNTLRFSTSSAKTINTWNMRTLGTMYVDTNTLKVGGSWVNLGTFIPNTGTVVFNATSSTRTIDSTGAISATFYNVTFGESGSIATWNLLSALTATGTFSVSFGTTSPGAYALTLQGDLTIGASGTFQKGTATTTFSGSTAKAWTDSTASKQDLGNILIDGATKTLNLSSSVRATNVTIGADDTLSLNGSNTLFTFGYFNNLGTFTAVTGTVDFSATTTGKIINQGGSSFYNVTFSGVGGTWSWADTNATATNDLLITGAGTTTLPSGVLAVGGSFNNTGGVFLNNSGEVRFTSTASGKTVRGSGSSWNNMVFAGSGGAWTFADTNATTTGTLSITAGTPTLPSGTLAVGNSFNNTSGAFVANGGILKMTSALTARTIRLSGSSLANLLVSGSGTFTIPDTNATATADVLLASGTTTLPATTFAVGGSFLVTGTGVFDAQTNIIKFNPASGTKTVSPSTSLFANVEIAGSAPATVNIIAHATATAFTIISGNFTQSSATNLSITGTFTNQTGGASTTWTGSTLKLMSGTEYVINGKTTGADAYDTLFLGANTKIKSWNSSASTYNINASAYYYSQNHASVPGALQIFGAYARTTGTEYWSAQTDFDGTPLATSSHRAVAVRFDSGATASFTNVGFEILGTSTATTTIDRISSGSFGVLVASSTLNASYYRFNNLNATGLHLTGSTTIAGMNFGNFELDTSGGTAITIASTTINQNTGLQIFNVRFALGAAVGGFNVTEPDAAGASNYIRFKNHGGNLAGEANDVDPLGNPGNIRWDDSNFIINISGTVFSDAGATEMVAPTCDGVTSVVTVKVSGGGVFSAPCQGSGVATGTYTVSGVTFSGETVMTIYLNTGGGAKATLVTKSASGDLTGINLYQNRVIVRHEDVSPMNILDMNAYDSADDTDIAFTAATSVPNTLSVNPETEFWVWTGKTFVPDGNITLNSGGSGNNWDGTFHVDNSAVFIASSTEAHSVGGRFVIDAGGTFTSASSTFTFTATTSGKVITGVSSLQFWNMIFNGAGGNWSVSQTTSVGGDLTVTQGTMSGTASVTVSGTNVTGAGTIAMTGGTFTLQNGGVFGGASDWSFQHLTFSGANGTTTKTASSTVTIAGVLTISADHTLLAGLPSEWDLAGGSTPFVVNGTFIPQSSTVRYSAGSATNITGGIYYRLYLAPASAGGPTYTLASSPLTVQSTLLVGDGVNTGTTTANTNDPSITLLGDVIIRATSTLVASDSSSLDMYQSFLNQGLFTHSSGTVNFLATSTGKTITMASSSLYNAVFNSGSGGWTMIGNATTSNNLSLTDLSSFTVGSGTTLEVKGTFTNSVGGASTNWTGATLYLNSGTSYTINATTTGADSYDTLVVGANTDVRMWNSVATTTTVSASGSLYSQDHDATNGLLHIWGDYQQTATTDYWSYVTDFDGRDIGGTPRAVAVRIATGSSVTISGSGALEIVGSATASTTVDVLAGGAYAFNISGGSTTMGYYAFRNTNGNGVNISGSPTINSMSDGDFELAQDGGSMITIAGSAIDANPLKILMRNRFATSSGITSGFNVKATGSSASAWRFNIHTGNRAGEAYDSDPGGDPGYLIWDDSAAQINISGNVYSDEGVTPIGAPTCNGVTQNVRLRVQGGGTHLSACDAGTGAFSISNITFNPGDTLSLYLDTGGGARAANISLDPATNISNMHLYRDRVVVRHEQGNPMTISAMDQYDGGNDPDIPFVTTLGGTNTLTTPAGVGLIVWTSKVFAPGGNVTLHANASSSPVDGTVKLYATSTWSASGSQTHTVGGSFYAASGASVAPANSTFVFVATTSGKVIAATSSLTFYNLTLGGANGAFDIGGVGTTSNDLMMTAGTTTLPSATLAVGGNFDANGAVFLNNSGTVKFTSGASGKTIRANGSSFNHLLFAGSGGTWAFQDVNATSSGSVVMSAGTVTLPLGVFAVGADFDNQSGAFVAGASSTLKMISASAGRIIRFGGSSLGGLHVSGNGVFTIPDLNATTTSNVVFEAGTTTLPTNAFATYGSFTNQAVFIAGTSTVSFTATTGAVTIRTGSSTFDNVIVGGTGQFIVGQNATATNNFSLRSAGAFTLQSGLTLAVGGVFTNSVGGGATTWTNSILSLYGGTEYAINTKSSGGDAYGMLLLNYGTRLSAWNSTSTLYALSATSSLYSQDHNAVDGDLYIFGAYRREVGTDYWSYATDFDGTALGGSSRQVDVRFASSATAYFATGTTLQILGISTASTTVDRQGAGFYGLEVQSGYVNAGYYQFRNTDRTGLALTGTTTISALSYGDFELGFSGGQMLTIASTTIDQNASAQYFYVRFATSSGVYPGINIRRNGTTTNAVTFSSEYGNLASEAFDEDGDTACGSIRFTDSACLQSDQKTFRFRNDDGGEGAPSSEWYDQNWSKRKRIRLTNNSATQATSTQFKIQVAYDADMQSDFDDLRFTDSSGTTSIPFWIESYSASVTSTVWVKTVDLPGSGVEDIFVYYGNGSATYGGVGTSTFIYFDDFEDGSMSEYSGNTSLFEQSTSFNYERTRGLDASAGNEGTGKTTDGVGDMSAGVGRDSTIRFFQYIDMTSGGSDEPCTLFAMQSPITNHQNYGVCLSPFGTDEITIVKNASNNGRNDGATVLATKTVTYTTGWYEVSIDWLSSGNTINVNVYDSTGAFFASTTASDSSYTSGGIGYSYWGQHGGWDIPSARKYISATPTIAFFVEQGDSGATWKASENATLLDQLVDQNVRLRLTLRNTGTTLTDQNFRLQVADKGGSANCESVPAGNFADVPTTSGSCGSSPACMKTSTQFSDKSSTTQLLSIPTGMTFTQGQIMEDPSNQTGNVTIQSGQFTEVEYNFQMTAFASQSAYCFRATKAGTALDNYTKVAELRMLHAPTLSNFSFNHDTNIALTEGTTTTIYATSTVTDFNGYADLVNASSTFYRSGVAGGVACTADNNNCYQVATTSCTFESCSGNSCTVSCSANMYYFADPTDVGSIFSAQDWVALIDVWDNSLSHDTASSSQELYTLRGLTIPATINYGSVTVGQDTGSANSTTTVNNTGNVILDLDLGGDPLTAGASTINYDKQKYATTTFTYSSCPTCNLLTASTSPTFFPLSVTKPTSTNPFFKDIYWGIQVPLGTSASTHSGTNYFTAQ